MFKHLERFALLAVCLLAIVIVMGSCGRDDPPIEPPKEKTFKEQLVSEGPWRVVSLEGDRIETFAQGLADGISLTFGLGVGIFETREDQNSLRFDTSGEITWNYETTIFLDRPDEGIRVSFTIKGPYFVNEDSGSSATLSLSFTEADAEFRVDDEAVDLSEEVEEAFFGDIADDERASINGDQLRIGDSLFERID